jgi:hypothetical protein
VVVVQHSFVWDNLLAVGMLVEVLQGMPAVVYCISVEVLLVAVDTQHTLLELDLMHKRTCSRENKAFRFSSHFSLKKNLF